MACSSVFRVGGLCQDQIGEVSGQWLVFLGFRAGRQPVGVGGEGIPFLVALGKILPLQDIVKIVVAFADRGRPETDLSNAEPLPQLQGVIREPRVERGQLPGKGVIDAQFVNHASISFFGWNSGPDFQYRFVIVTLSPSRRISSLPRKLMPSSTTGKPPFSCTMPSMSRNVMSPRVT